MSATHPLSLTACCNRKLHRHRAVPQFAAAKVQHFPESAKRFRKKIRHDTNFLQNPFVTSEKYRTFAAQ